MNVIYRTRFWCVLPIALGAVLVSSASARVIPTARTAAAEPMTARLARSVSLAPRTWVTGRRERPSARSHVAANANPATYTDATGDAGTAADITSVVVSNDAGNRVTFRVNVVKLVVPSDGTILIAIDSDHSAATGYHGVDYLFIGDLSTNSFMLGRWDGSDFVDAGAASATASTDTTGLTFAVNSSDLGMTTAFSFWARTVQGRDVAAGNHDDAPDTGVWDYQLGSGAPLSLSVGITTVSKARAGKPFIAVIEVIRSDGADTTLTQDDVSCAAKIGAAPLNARSAVGLGPAASCGWILPKKSHGKRLRASVTVELDGATVTKTFTKRIR
jgi:hypothetical protein